MYKSIRLKYLIFVAALVFIFSSSFAQQTLPQNQQPTQTPVQSQQQTPVQQQITGNQNLSTLDLSTINVDQLTDSQIKNYLQRAQQSGLTQDQIEAALRARGLPETEIAKLKQRVASIMSGQQNVNVGQGYTEVRTRVKPVQNDIFEALTMTPEQLVVTETQRKLFGFSLFNSQNLTFNPSVNIPTPKDYQLGPGDQVIIDIWGASQQTYQQTISPDGYIIIPNLGPIFLTGLTIDKASIRVKERLTQIYSGLAPANGSKPNTFFQLSLGQVRTIKVNIIGEAQHPGTYDVPSLASVFNALYLSGGPSINGSFRDIELVRDNKLFTTLDVYEFLMGGIQNNNIQLEDQDIVRIIPYTTRVEIQGEVKREGIYEMRSSETFNDLIRFAGGFTANAYRQNIKVTRNTNTEKKLLTINGEDLGKFQPESGDLVTITAILDRFQNRVQIAGAVYREGQYELTDSLTILKLIRKAEGLTGDAFLERATLYRTNDDFTTETIPFNIRKILKGEDSDIPLKREDFLRITSIYDLREEYYVTINGSVRDPGNYSFMENMSVGDLIVQAGGLLESADVSNVEVARRVIVEGGKTITNTIAEIYDFPLNKDLSIQDKDKRFILQPFDNVFIRKSPAYQAPIKIRIEGEVIYPGDYILKSKNERISDLIKRAGGVREEGYVDGATLIRQTEFYEPPSETESRYNDLISIRQQLYDKYANEDNLSMTESEYLRVQRLANLEKNVANYKNRQEAEFSSVGVQQLRSRIQELQRRDTTITGLSIYKYETIGINLAQILKNPGSKFDLILQDGDVISIPKKLETVRMRGEFLYPITARYDQRNTFRDYLSQAGGFTENARPRKTYVIYANGSVDRTRRFLLLGNRYPKIKPGAEIIVPTKPEREATPAQVWIALGTSIATLALIIKSLIP